MPTTEQYEKKEKKKRKIKTFAQSANCIGDISYIFFDGNGRKYVCMNIQVYIGYHKNNIRVKGSHVSDSV